jgi:hypothetical protein
MLHLTGTYWLAIIFHSVLRRDVHTFHFMLFINYHKLKTEVYVFEWVYMFYLQALSKDMGSPHQVQNHTAEQQVARYSISTIRE